MISVISVEVLLIKNTRMLARVGCFLLFLTQSFAKVGTRQCTTPVTLNGVQDPLSTEFWIKVPVDRFNPVKLEFDFIDPQYPGRLAIEPVEIVDIFGATTPTMPPTKSYKLKEKVVPIETGTYLLEPHQKHGASSITLRYRYVAVRHQFPSHTVLLIVTYSCYASSQISVTLISAEVAENRRPRDPPLAINSRRLRLM